MRLDYTLYALAAVLLIATVVPFIIPIGGETSETRSVWVVSTVVLGLLSIGLGYSQRPKTEAQACQPAMPTSEEATLEINQPALKKEKAVIKEVSRMSTPTIAAMELTQVKGIGEKRAIQLKTLGIDSVHELAGASAKTIAKKLKISSKIVSKWVEDAKILVK